MPDPGPRGACRSFFFVSTGGARSSRLVGVSERRPIGVPGVRWDCLLSVGLQNSSAPLPFALPTSRFAKPSLRARHPPVLATRVAHRIF